MQTFDYDRWLTTDPYEAIDEQARWQEEKWNYEADWADLQYGEDKI